MLLWMIISFSHTDDLIYDEREIKTFLNQLVIFETNMFHVIHITREVKKILRRLYVV